MVDYIGDYYRGYHGPTLILPCLPLQASGLRRGQRRCTSHYLEWTDRIIISMPGFGHVVTFVKDLSESFRTVYEAQFLAGLLESSLHPMPRPRLSSCHHLWLTHQNAGTARTHEAVLGTPNCVSSRSQ